MQVKALKMDFESHHSRISLKRTGMKDMLELPPHIYKQRMYRYNSYWEKMVEFLVQAVCFLDIAFQCSFTQLLMYA